MPAEFQRDGIQFLYPENWKLDLQIPSENIVCALSLEAPSGAIWSVNVEQGLRDRQELVAKILETLRDEYDEVEAEPYTGRIGDYETVGYEMYFYCIELVVKSVVQCYHTKDRTFLVMTQAESRDHDELDPVFGALAASLAAESKPPTG